ncbi:MAG TPA: PA1414 family protein [Pseudomonas sp.]|nr:PA1414 family protein [Pseudomonas sp.]
MKTSLHSLVRQFLEALGVIQAPQLQPIPLRSEQQQVARKPARPR